VGLPAGFLQAGIPQVVGTLWPVNDRSTALLVTRCYEYHLRGDPAIGLPPQPVAAALRLAQRWLRDVNNTDLGKYLDAHQRLKEQMARDDERMSWVLIKDERRRVRQALREGRGDERPFADPYFWAPFTFFGVF
jgi:CHAT domain-containing protein